MSYINRIHATTLSMNDRFTIMQRVGRSALENDQKVSMVPNTDVSVRNRFLLEQLERKHKLRTALQIKRKRLSTRPTMVAKRPQTLKRGAVTAAPATLGAKKIRQRLNSVSKQIATLEADLLNEAARETIQRHHSTSQVSIIDRLGFRVRSVSRSRSMSRNHHSSTRSNPNQNLLQGANSQTRVRGRSVSRQRLNLQTRQIQAQRNASSVRNGHRLIRRRSRSNLRKAVTVNERLGVRRGGNNAIGKNIRIRRGRIAKQRNSNAVRNQIAKGNTQQTSGRSRSRTRRNKNKNSNAMKQQQQNAGGQQIRDRSRNRRARRGRHVKRESVKSKEDLDMELDQYMCSTKSGMNYNELGIHE